MAQFFRLWKRLEDTHLTPYRDAPAPRYALYEGKFTRTLALPRDRDYTSEEVAKAISDYIQLFDHLMKGFLAGRYTARNVEEIFYSQLTVGQIMV